MAEIYPTVIPPLKHTYKSVTYTCAGEGLCKDNYTYDPHAERALPTKKSDSRNAKVAEKKPAAWWKAQCAFRGLNQSGSISDLQSRLREAKKKMLPELKALESQMNIEYKKQNEAFRDAHWQRLTTAEEKAEAYPEKFLNEAFPKSATGRPTYLDIVIIKTEHRAALHECASKMGLETVSVDAPWVGNTRPIPDRWIIIGRSRDAVWNQMRDIQRSGAKYSGSQDTSQPQPKAKVRTPRATTDTPKKQAVIAARPRVLYANPPSVGVTVSSPLFIST